MGRPGRIAMVLSVIALAAVGLWSGWRMLEDQGPDLGHRSSVCEALAQDVDGVGSIDWTNGITSSGSWWIQVLGAEGIQEADRPSRDRIAAGVAADDDGFDRLRSAAPEEARPALDRLRALALDPDEAARRAADPDVARDLATITRTSDCGWAP